MSLNGSLDGLMALPARIMQGGLGIYAGLSIPTLLLQKSNEVVASTIVGTVMTAVILFSLFAVFSGMTGENYSIFDYIEYILASIASFIAIVIYYLGEREL